MLTCNNLLPGLFPHNIYHCGIYCIKGYVYFFVDKVCLFTFGKFLGLASFLSYKIQIKHYQLYLTAASTEGSFNNLKLVKYCLHH